MVTCKFPKGETTGCHSNEQTAKDIAALRAFTGEGKTHQPRKEKPKSKIYRFEAINLNFTSEELRKIRSDFYEGLHCEEFLPYKVQLVKQQEKSKIIIETEDINAAFSMAKKFKDTFLCVLRKYGICDYFEKKKKYEKIYYEMEKDLSDLANRQMSIPIGSEFNLINGNFSIQGMGCLQVIGFLELSSLEKVLE